MTQLLTAAGMDWETTGFLEPDHKIIEACVIKYEFNPLNPSERRIVDRLVQRIDPQRSIPAAATGVHKIVASDLVGKPTFKQVAPSLYKILHGSDIGVAHNGIDFDFPFLIQELEGCSHPIPDFVPFDTMLEGRWATAWGEVPNLQKLCIACGVDYDPDVAHAAEYDVEKMMDCFFWGLEHGWFKLPT